MTPALFCPGCGARKNARVCARCDYDEEPLGLSPSAGRPGPLDVERTLARYDHAARQRLKELGYPWGFREPVPIPDDEERRPGSLDAPSAWPPAARPGVGAVLLLDSEVGGLGRRDEAASETFVLDWRTTAGEPHRFHVGPRPPWSQEAARARARQLIERFPNGFPGPEPIEEASVEAIHAAAQDAAERWSLTQKGKAWAAGEKDLETRGRKASSPIARREEKTNRVSKAEAAAWRQVQDALSLLVAVENGRRTVELSRRGEIEGTWLERWLFGAGFHLGEAAARSDIRVESETAIIDGRRTGRARRDGTKNNAVQSMKFTDDELRVVYEMYLKGKASTVKVTRRGAARYIAPKLNQRCSESAVIQRLEKLGLP